MSEANAGSDMVGMKLRAEEKGDRYLLNGCEDVDHQRQRRRHDDGLRGDRDRRSARTASPPSSSRRASRASALGASWTGSACAAPHLPVLFEGREGPAENVLGERRHRRQGPDERPRLRACRALGRAARALAACVDLVLPFIHERKQFGQRSVNASWCRARWPKCSPPGQASRAYVYAVGQACDRGDRGAACARTRPARSSIRPRRRPRWPARRSRRSAARLHQRVPGRAPARATPSSTRSAPAQARYGAC